MRNLLLVALAMTVCFTSAACGRNNIEGSATNQNPDEKSQNSAAASGQDFTDETESVENTKIKLMIGNEEVIVNIYDNPTSRDFLTMLPITASFEDYVGKEKISYLPRKLNTEPSSSKSDPSVGNFAYFAPWGNLAIFYNGPATAGDGLIVLGEIESGIEGLSDKLASMNDGFTVRIEKMELS